VVNAAIADEYPGGNRDDRGSTGVTEAMLQWLGFSAVKIAAFYAETVMGDIEDFKSVMTQKDRV